jgi:hypothetical protein
MIAVSNGWVDAHTQTLLPEAFVEITYAATDPSLQAAASVTGANQAAYSDPSTLVANTDKRGEKLATLEQGLWGLDGTFTFLDGTPENPGFVSSAVSQEDGSFSTFPTIIISFPTLRQEVIPGLTIKWSDTYNEWATSYRVTALAGSNLIAQETVVENTDPTSVVWLTMEGYNQIVIQVLGWSHPKHRARCTEIFLGVETVYTKNDLMGFEHTQTVDLLSASLPKNEVTFRLRNEDNRWNPDNPTGNEQYLIERQEIRIRYGMDIDGEIEWIKGGTFWLSEWSTPANGLEASFTARDLIEFMNEAYTGIRSGSLYEIAVAAFTQADLPTQDDGVERWLVSENLKGITTEIPADDDYTIAEVLQMVAHAAGCVFYQDRDGIVRVEPWNTSYSGYMIDQKVCYAHPEYTFDKPMKAISVGYGADQREVIAISDKGAVQTIDNPLLLTRADAQRVGDRAREVLENRKTVSGEFRADLRLDALDPVIVTSKYATNIVAVTDIKYTTTGGAFRGSYTGRVVSLALQTDPYYSGEIFAGEITG